MGSASPQTASPCDSMAIVISRCSMQISALARSVVILLKIFSLRVKAETRNRPLGAMPTGNNVTDGFLDINYLVSVYTDNFFLFVTIADLFALKFGQNFCKREIGH
jgi:hypothetical protein